jgi:hypothetical protein
MPPLIKTSKESARDDVWATQMPDAICTAEAISAAAKAKNLYRLIILFVLPFLVAYRTPQAKQRFPVER